MTAWFYLTPSHKYCVQMDKKLHDRVFSFIAGKPEHAAIWVRGHTLHTGEEVYERMANESVSTHMNKTHARAQKERSRVFSTQKHV